MAIRSGIAAQIGVATETTWGTFAAPTTYFPFTSEGLSRENEYVRTAGLRAGQLSQSGLQHVKTTHQAAGSVEIDFLTKGMGKLLNLLHGNTVTPAQIASTTAYRQTHQVGLTDPYGKGLSLQVGRPDVGGTVRPFSYTGSKLMSATFAMERGGILTSEWEFDCEDETTGESLGTATYSAVATAFPFQGGSIEIDDVALTDCIRSATVAVTLPHETERYCISASSTKKEQILNGVIAVEITFEAEFASLTHHTAFVNATRRKVEFLNSTGDAGGGNAFQANFTAAQTVTTGAGPVVGGPDVLTQELTCEVVANGTDPPLVVEVVSTDLTL